VRGAFDDVEDISAVSTPFTTACGGHPLVPIPRPIVVRCGVCAGVYYTRSSSLGKPPRSDAPSPLTRSEPSERGRCRPYRAARMTLRPGGSRRAHALSIRAFAPSLGCLLQAPPLCAEAR
jgi:hypothetical protein